jgi:enamine deaminase RidA (YjgF/YER057c/UK114 family)
MGKIATRIAELGLELPPINPSQGNYLPYRQTGNLVFIAGQGPRRAGELIWKGIVGDDLTLENAQDAARMCALNLLAQLDAACDGDLDRVTGVIRLAGLVRCSADFEQQAKVLNAASDLICDVFGSAGAHARIASGTHALPSGMAVEIEAIFEVGPAA